MEDLFTYDKHVILFSRNQLMLNKIYSSISYISKNTLPDDDLYGEMFCVSKKINDAGGLLREWVHIISTKIVDRSLGTFTPPLFLTF